MNNMMNIYSPYDSLGRRIGIANNFALFTDTQLSSMKNELGLFMGIEQLKFIRDHYKNTKQTAILLEEVYLLDEIFKASGNINENALIYEVSTENKELASVYEDLLQKRRVTAGDNAPMMSLSDAANVYSLYSQSIGLTPKEASLQKEKLSFDDKTAFIYLYSESNDSEYDKNAMEFISTEAFSNLAYLAKKIDKRGIAYALATLSDGIYADLHSIPDLNVTPELSHLATEAYGKYIVATKKENIDILSELAQEFSLKCSYFARAYSNKKFTLRKVGRTQMSLDTSLILHLGNYKYKGAFYLDDEDYVKRQNELVDTLLPSLANGAALDEISISAKYDFSENASDEHIKGRALSAVLGTYRAEVELCVAAKKAEVNYTDIEYPEAKFSSCCNKKQKLELSDIHTDAYIYFLSFNKNENGTPDYNSLRTMCKTVKNLIDSDCVLYSLSLVGCLQDAINELLRYLNVGISKKLPFALDEKLSGILVISTAEIKNAMFLGMVAPVNSAKVNDMDNQNS